jgi:NADH-ubiquinone oxidoreductase chain 4
VLKLNILLLSIIISTFLTPYKIKWWSTCATLTILSIIIITYLPYSTNIISNISIIDTISITLITLRLFITVLIIISRTKIIISNNIYKIFIITCLILLLTLLNAFSSCNLFLFYIWFEASLVPTIIIIIVWGYQPERVQASIYIIIYTIIASLPILFIFIIIYINPNSYIIYIPYISSFSSNILSILLIRGFLVKLPIYITHLWLPKAHVEAPIAGRIVLAAILLKLGGYGVCRIILIFPNKIMSISSTIISISLTGAIITRIICLRQPDLKSLIAYSSVGHIGLIISGTISISSWGISGTLIIIIAHGLCSSAIFSIANINYEILHTRRIFLIKGILIFLPSLTIWWFVFTAFNIAAPPSINLLREIILITAALSFSMYYILFLAMITFLTGVYSLNIYGNTQHGYTINFINPAGLSKAVQNLLLISHLIPIIALIVIPELIIT